MSKKIRYPLAVALFVSVMLSACQIVISSESQKDTGDAQSTSPGQQTDNAANPILSIKNLGMYDIDGEDIVYRKGEWQLSRNYSPDGKTVSFNIIDPALRTAYTVSGIKTSAAQQGHSIYVTFTARTPEKEIKSFSSSAKVMGVSGDTLWLKTSQGPYFVVKK